MHGGNHCSPGTSQKRQYTTQLRLPLRFKAPNGLRRMIEQKCSPMFQLYSGILIGLRLSVLGDGMHRGTRRYLEVIQEQPPVEASIGQLVALTLRTD